MIRVLFVSDWAHTGFGTVGDELCTRLANMEIFDVHYLGWHAQPNNLREAAARKITLHLTNYWDRNDVNGQHTLNRYVEAIRPQVIISLGDPWMVDHIAAIPGRENIYWLCYMPIDRDVLSRLFVNVLRKPDVLVTFSQFGQDIVEEQIKFRHPRLILHGVDRKLFAPWYPEGTDENTPLPDVMRARKAQVLGRQFADKFVVGWVGRNQVRKALPRNMRAFKAFNCATWIERQDIEATDPNTGEVVKYNAEDFCRNRQCFKCDVCPAFQQRPETVDSTIYLHTTRGTNPVQDGPGIGWLVDELSHRLRLHNQVGMTPNLGYTKGLERGAMAAMYNCFDAFLFLSHSEGFGLPIAEALSCGVPTFVTNYTSMPELVKDGGGVAIDVREYDTFTTYENDFAYADIGHAADEINKVFEDHEYALSMRKAAAANQYTPDWAIVAKEFRDLILEAVGQEM